MPSPSNLPLSFNRDRTERQLDARFEALLEKLRINRPSEDPWMVRRAYAAPAIPICRTSSKSRTFSRTCASTPPP
jgi:hypothetical protein